MKLASVTRLKTPPVPPERTVAAAIDRQKLRRHVLAALLQHGCDGIRGDCYCGLHPRNMWKHMTSAVAEGAQLLLDYVWVTMDAHSSVTAATSDLCRCVCGDEFAVGGIAREEHWADILTENLTAHEAARCLTEIRKVGQA
jgi:hypothetical protein